MAGVVDSDPERAADAAAKYNCPILELSEVSGVADAAIVATPTVTHAELGCALIEAGLDVLLLRMVEKEPSYGMSSPVLFVLFAAYERVVNSTERLAVLRANIFCVLKKPAG